MCCYLNSENDDMPPLNALAQALEALRAAEQQLYHFAGLIDGDAVRPRDLDGQSIDARITKLVGEVFTKRYAFDRALCSLMLGEEFRPYPSQQAVRIEMQARAHRPVGGASFDLLRTAMARVDAARPDAPLPAPERRSETRFAELDAGFGTLARA